MANCYDYVHAFLKNCPRVRLTAEDRLELVRLFLVCHDEALLAGRRIQIEEQKRLLSMQL